VATPEGRDKFSNAITAAYDEYKLDGIDLDWEYCGVEGYAGNGITSEDCDNFLSFLRILRNKLPPEAVITAATRVVPFAGSDGKPMTDVSAFAKVLDWVMVMNYDTVGCKSISPRWSGTT
jgi:chitinase